MIGSFQAIAVILLTAYIARSTVKADDAGSTDEDLFLELSDGPSGCRSGICKRTTIESPEIMEREEDNMKDSKTSITKRRCMAWHCRSGRTFDHKDVALDNDLATLRDTKRLNNYMSTMKETKSLDNNRADIRENKRLDNDLATIRENKRLDNDREDITENKRLDNDLATIRDTKRLDNDLATIRENKRLDNDLATIRETKRLNNDLAAIRETKRLDNDLAAIRENKRLDNDLATIRETKRGLIREAYKRKCSTINCNKKRTDKQMDYESQDASKRRREMKNTRREIENDNDSKRLLLKQVLIVRKQRGDKEECLSWDCKRDESLNKGSNIEEKRSADYDNKIREYLMARSFPRFPEEWQRKK